MTGLAMLLAALAGLSLTLALAGVTRRHPHLASALQTLHPVDPSMRAQRVPVVGEDAPWLDRVGAWAETRTARWRILRAPEADLELLEIPRASHCGRKAVGAFVGFAAATLVPLVLGLGVVLPFGLGLLAALFGWVVPDLTARDAAAARREDAAYAAVSYLRLVAISRAAGAGLVRSLESASRTSDVWLFARIRRELSLAKLAGVPAWDALDRLGRDVGVPELREVGDVVRLADRAGAAVTDTLMARAASLRDRLLTKEETEAAQATSSMSIPLASLAAVFLVALIVPAALQLTQVSP